MKKKKRKIKKAQLRFLLDQTKNLLVSGQRKIVIANIDLVFTEKLLPKEERKFYKKIYKQILKLERELKSNLQLDHEESNILHNKITLHLIELNLDLEKFT